MVPTESIFKIIPRTTVLLCKPPPKSFATRTLSTLKFAGFLGHTCMHAYIFPTRSQNVSVVQTKYSIIVKQGNQDILTSATSEHIVSSWPNCLLATAAFILETTCSLSRTSIVSEPFSTSSSNISTVWNSIAFKMSYLRLSQGHVQIVPLSKVDYMDQTP